jgi:hypothetical protein
MLVLLVQILLDSEPDAGSHHLPGSRLLTSFVGGLDLCNGRYDDEAHSLFRTLTTLHSEDMHQPCIPGAEIKFGGEQCFGAGHSSIVSGTHMATSHPETTSAVPAVRLHKRG